MDPLFLGFWAACGIAGLLYFAPLGYRSGHPYQGIAAALLAAFLGPFSLIVLIPWALIREGKVPSLHP